MPILDGIHPQHSCDLKMPAEKFPQHLGRNPNFVETTNYNFSYSDIRIEKLQALVGIADDRHECDAGAASGTEGSELVLEVGGRKEKERNINTVFI